MNNEEYVYAEIPGSLTTRYTKVIITMRGKKTITVQHPHLINGISTVFTKRKDGEWLEKGKDKSKSQQRLRFDIEHVEQFLKEMEEVRETHRRQSQLIADFQRKLGQITGMCNFGDEMEATLTRCLEEISLAETRHGEDK